MSHEWALREAWWIVLIFCNFPYKRRYIHVPVVAFCFIIRIDFHHFSQAFNTTESFAYHTVYPNIRLWQKEEWFSRKYYFPFNTARRTHDTVLQFCYLSRHRKVPITKLAISRFQSTQQVVTCPHETYRDLSPYVQQIFPYTTLFQGENPDPYIQCTGAILRKSFDFGKTEIESAPLFWVAPQSGWNRIFKYSSKR